MAAAGGLPGEARSRARQPDSTDLPEEDLDRRDDAWAPKRVVDMVRAYSPQPAAPAPTIDGEARENAARAASAATERLAIDELIAPESRKDELARAYLRGRPDRKRVP